MKKLILVFSLFMFININSQPKNFSNLQGGIFTYENVITKEQIFLYVYYSSIQIYYISNKESFLSKEFSKSLLGSVIKDKKRFKVTYNDKKYTVYIEIRGKMKKFLLKKGNVIQE